MKIYVILSLLFFKQMSCEKFSVSSPVCNECMQKRSQLLLEIVQLKEHNANLRTENSIFKNELYKIKDNHEAHHRAKRNTLSRQEKKGTDFASCGVLAKNAGVLSPNIENLSDNYKSFYAFFDKQSTNSKNLKCSSLANHVGYLAHNLKSLLEDAKHFNNFIDKQLEKIDLPKMCADFKLLGNVCNAEESNGEWTAIQRRIDGKTNFYRGWDEYKRGFGTITGEFFVGLECLHLLTTCASQELLIEMEDHENQKRYAKYDLFQIGDESEKYVMKELGEYEGDAGNSLKRHKLHMFTTYDQDNDRWTNGNCAKDRNGTWWYDNCLDSNLNGEYGNKKGKGIIWGQFHGGYYSLKKVEMKIRPKN